MDQITALRLFVRLAERASFSAAAKDLAIKQSTASKWVAELEAEHAVQLVERTTRAVRLTDAGQRMLVRARELVAAFDELKAEFAERSPEPRGRVRISVPVVFGRRFVIPALASYLRRHAKVSAEVVMNDRYVNLVEEGFDLAVRVGIPSDTSARGRKIADGRRVLVAAPRYVRAYGQPSSPSDLRAHECLVHGDANTATHWRFGGERGATTPVQVRGRFAANNSEAVLALARRGLGIALLADWLVHDDLARDRLCVLLPDYAAPPAPVYALSPPGRFASITLRTLIDHLEFMLAPLLRAAQAAAPVRRAR